MAKKDALHITVGVSKELAKIIGPGPHTRISVTTRLWEYIQANDLLLETKPPMSIQPDALLEKVLGTRRRLNAHELTELVTRHVISAGRRASTAKTPATRGGNLKSSGSAGHWIWVTKPEFYENADGSSALAVGPQEGWWTCARQTKAGDLALLYRAKTRKDIAYLILATTNAFSILEDPFVQERSWEWACDYDVLYEFTDPVPLSVLRTNQEFWDWSALRMNFQGRAFEMDDRRWKRLIELALPSNPGLAKFVGVAPGFSAPKRILAERELEDSLTADIGKLRKAGWDLEVWHDPKTGRSGRQFVCAAAGGRIDLLCQDRASGQLVVVELKNVIATEQTYMQTWRYVSWVQRFLADGKPVSALVVARGCDSRFELMAEASDRKVRFMSLRDIGLE